MADKEGKTGVALVPVAGTVALVFILVEQLRHRLYLTVEGGQETARMA
jgi:hypothetical protein